MKQQVPNRNAIRINLHGFALLRQRTSEEVVLALAYIVETMQSSRLSIGILPALQAAKGNWR